MTDLQTIEARRMRDGLSQAALCRSAEVSTAFYRRLLRGERQASAATIARLRRGLQRSHAGYGAEAGGLAPSAALKSLIALVARERGADPAAALASDPARRATQDDEWMGHALTRGVAMYLANGAMGFRTADIARAIGLTKQAVSLAVRKIEDDRDIKQDLDRLLLRLEGWLS